MSSRPNRKWYSLTKILSYNKMLNFIMSHRGGGKTYSCKKLAIKNFLNKGEEFIYLRRYKTELKGDNLLKWFDDVAQEFPDVKFKVKGNNLIINDKVAGYAIALTQQVQVRSTPFPNVTTIIFDEFILDDRGTNLKYLNNEVKTFLEILSTIIRSRNNVRVICCANSISYINPYFEYWKIRIDPENKKEFYNSPISKQVIVQLFNSQKFKDEMELTRFGQLIKGTNYGNYAINNDVLLDNQEFIMKEKPKDALFKFGLKYDNSIYGVWYSDTQLIYYINKQHNPTSTKIIAITNDDQSYKMNSIKALKKNSFFLLFKMYLNNGLVFYETQGIKKSLFNIYKIIGI